jgi:hypothetical protein
MPLQTRKYNIAQLFVDRNHSLKILHCTGVAAGELKSIGIPKKSF